jgi:hypothetical protein
MDIGEHKLPRRRLDQVNRFVHDLVVNHFHKANGTRAVALVIRGLKIYCDKIQIPLQRFLEKIQANLNAWFGAPKPPEFAGTDKQDCGELS